MSTRKIDDLTRDVLSRSIIAENVVKLPGHLPREDYVKIDKALKSLGGKWDRKAGGHVFPFPASELVAGAVVSGTYIDRKQDGQMFWTPEPLALRMATMAQVGPGKIALEPSAGIGRLVIPLLATGADVVAIEKDATNYLSLSKIPGVVASCWDFLDYDGAGHRPFDAVAMNPPFSGGQDIAHVMAAWRFVAPGGRLIAIMSDGTFCNSRRRDIEFCDWLSAIDGTSEKLPINTFKESGTGVSVRLVQATKGVTR